MKSDLENIKLPQPKYKSNTSLEEALLKRRSVRNYQKTDLTLSDISQLLWAAQGITKKDGLRTSPSAGALYPLEVYLAASAVTNLPPGIYHYSPQKHFLKLIKAEDKRSELALAAFGQDCIRESAAAIIFSAVYQRTIHKYGNKRIFYIYMEVGHAVQNVYLQAVSLGLGTVVVGAFDENLLRETITLRDEEQPLCIMPVGKM